MIRHKSLASGKWYELSLFEQLANVGTDVDRAIKWRNKNNRENSQNAFERALELMTFTIMDPKHKKRLRELTRIREVLLDYFMGDNQYGSTDELWHKYFYQYNYAAAVRRGK